MSSVIRTGMGQTQVLGEAGVARKVTPLANVINNGRTGYDVILFLASGYVESVPQLP